MRRFSFSLTVVSLLLGCRNEPSTWSDPATATKCDGTFVELAALCAKPSDFDGKVIKIEGYFRYRFEDVAIYETKDWRNEGESIWLNLDSMVSNFDPEDRRSLAGDRIIVIGVFDEKRKGHMGRYCGTRKVTCVQVE